MSHQLLVNTTAFETRVALLENGQLIELMLERNADKGLVGNIYLAKVQRVLPGMQAAFLNIGLEKSAFLYVGDILPHEPYDESDEPVESEERFQRPAISIQDLLKPGQTVLVQVMKDAIGTKGPRVNCNPSIPGHHVVFLPTSPHIGISRKIVDETERERLRRILEKNSPPGTGFIARTISQGVSEEKLSKDCAFLVSLWQDIQKRSTQLPAPSLVQPELDLLLKCARDMTNDHLERIIIDNQEAFERVRKFVELMDPKLCDRIEMHRGPDPLFASHSIETEITRAMNRKVWLRSGGYIVIDQAEALTVVDVNTGRFVGRRNLEETILKTNLEAVKEVAFQLRLRNVGGMIIIDFIDMEHEDDREKVIALLQDCLKKDKARCNVIKISELGLVEMTRQRKRESLEHLLCESCFYCDGKGTIKSKRSVAYEVFRELLERPWNANETQVVVQAHPEVIDFMRSNESGNLEFLESQIHKKLVLKARGSFHQEQFDVFASHLK
ncbi:MAG: Rne/Rng family ribonuclease [Myxococcota bacterium]